MATKLLYGSEEDLKDFNNDVDSKTPVAPNKEILAQYESTLTGYAEGSIVKGTIVRITDTDVFVDIRFKSEGVISKQEFKDDSELNVGRVIDVYLEQVENTDGQIILSKQRADFMRVWERIREAFEKEEIVTGTITRRIKGGVVVDLFGIEAFLPGSQIDLRQVPDLDALISQKMDFKVIKVNKIRRNIVVSRRVVLEQERSKMRDEIIDTLEKGQVREGVVKNITDFGAFIEIKEGVDGLIHVSDMSWTKKINHPSEVLKKGDKVECIVMAIDKEKRRISLSMKHQEDDPWETLAEKFPVGKEVQGKIARLLERGVIVELEGGVEGFIPTSKLTTENIRNPADTVPAAVIEVEAASRKLTLSVVGYFKNKEDAEWKSYLSAHKPNQATLGDVMPKLESE